MSKILVTGASGNVGAFVVKHLLTLNESVVCVGTNTNKLESMFKGTENRYFDFTKKETFDSALKDVDRVFLMRPPHLGKPEDLYPFVEFMKEKKIKLVSFLSLMGVEKNTIPPHHKIEKFIESVGLPYAHIRPGFFMENISGVHSEEIKKLNKIFIPAGKSKCSFISAEDIGMAVAYILHDYDKHINTTHTLTGSEALDYYQIAEILSEVLNREIKYAKPGFIKYRNYYIKERNLDKAYVNVTVALYFMTRMGTAEAVTDEFKKITGRNSKTFKEFVLENKKAFI